MARSEYPPGDQTPRKTLNRFPIRHLITKESVSDSYYGIAQGGVEILLAIRDILSFLSGKELRTRGNGELIVTTKGW